MNSDNTLLFNSDSSPQTKQWYKFASSNTFLVNERHMILSLILSSQKQHIMIHGQK